VTGAGDDGRVDFLGQPAISLRAPDGAAAVVLLHGAQLVSWQPAGGGERLFLSERSRFGAGEAVRGGVPVIFPQFSERGALPRHGFVRTRAWTPTRVEAGAGDALAVLQMTDDEATRALWPHAFALELTVCLRGERLDVELEVTNTGDESFGFTAALHTYLRVAEVEAARLTGLRGFNFEDSATGTTRVDAADALRIGGEVDRIYFGVGAPLVLSEERQRLRIEAANFPDVVVWNPWQEKAAAMADLAPGDFRRFLCVEAALIGRPMLLAAGEQWWGRQTLIAG
jgi:glucose-6-phosphate 1-epimerase